MLQGIKHHILDICQEYFLHTLQIRHHHRETKPNHQRQNISPVLIRDLLQRIYQLLGLL